MSDFRTFQRQIQRSGAHWPDGRETAEQNRRGVIYSPDGSILCSLTPRGWALQRNTPPLVAVTWDTDNSRWQVDLNCWIDVADASKAAMFDTSSHRARGLKRDVQSWVFDATGAYTIYIVLPEYVLNPHHCPDLRWCGAASAGQQTAAFATSDSATAAKFLAAPASVSPSVQARDGRQYITKIVFDTDNQDYAIYWFTTAGAEDATIKPPRHDIVLTWAYDISATPLAYCEADGYLYWQGAANLLVPAGSSAQNIYWSPSTGNLSLTDSGGDTWIARITTRSDKTCRSILVGTARRGLYGYSGTAYITEDNKVNIMVRDGRVMTVTYPS